MEDFPTVDDYINSFPNETKRVLSRIRETIHDALADAGEVMSYKMPTITLGERRIVHFAGWKSHVSLYPVPAGDAAFEKRIEPYVAGKGTLKFPLSEPIPYDLIALIAIKLSEQK